MTLSRHTLLWRSSCAHSPFKGVELVTPGLLVFNLLPSCTSVFLDCSQVLAPFWFLDASLIGQHTIVALFVLCVGALQRGGPQPDIYKQS